ncbi:MAG: outer membrane beta-barrel protein [Fodinibius sp.]|nr:outer membrane beta-barrel protein [Fodinibius sp.]
MKKLSCLAALVLFLACSSFAQKSQSTKFFVGTGVAFPITELDYYGYSQNYNFGGGVSGGLSFRVLPRFQFRTTISYFRARFDEQEFIQSTNIQNSGYTIDGGTETFFGLSGEFKYALRNSNYSILPYIIGGGGAYHLSHRNLHFPQSGSPTVSESSSHWAPTLKGGIGIEFNSFKNIGFFAEMNIAVSFPEGSETANHLPLTLGVTL